MSYRTVCLLCLYLIWGNPLPAANSPAVPPLEELQILSQAALESKSASQHRALERFAKRYEGETQGALANLALGYSAFQQKQFAKASGYFQAAHSTPTPLQDYAEYFQALSEQQQNRHETAVQLLQGFAARHHSSRLAAPAVLRHAESLLALDRASEVISLLLSPPVSLSPPEADLVLGDAYLKTKELDQAADRYQNIYYGYPNSAQAAEAEKKLQPLKARMGTKFPSPTREQRQTRADQLYRAGKWVPAQKEYQALTAQTTGEDRERWRVRVGVCQYQARANWPALETLKDLKASDPELDAERIYTVAAIYRRLDRRDSMEQQIRSLGEKYPKSPWHEKAFLLAANYYLMAKELDQTEQYYRKLYGQFPNGENAATVHWNVAWKAYRERRDPEARQLFEQHLRNYPLSPYAPAALYWLGRLVEKEQPAVAARYYQKIVETFPNFYYGLLARDRLKSLPPPAQVDGTRLLLDPIQRTASAVNSAGKPSSQSQLATYRAKLLQSAWLMDWAIDELKAALVQDAAATTALGAEVALLEKQRGRDYEALRNAKRFFMGYLSLQMGELRREAWETLFPLPWWEQIQKNAKQFQLDPHVVAGLIRQESEFNPTARSRSNARGLMQLLPTTAQEVARKVPDRQARQYSLAKLFLPEINLIYGTHYLKTVLERFDGKMELALAGYNAGPRRVQEWLSEGSFDDLAEFVESIPIT
ncbi:MAG: transglycosylase SLT domain-containing protein, partial [Acidobacteria bacterium]|nr:transglycosylase SLT domain-containing protein [Acidobacteriota bacterium]